MSDGSGDGAPGHAVAVDVEIAAELAALFEIGGRHHLAALQFARVVPGERRAKMRIHANVEIKHDEDRRLQLVRQVEGERAKIEGFARAIRQQEHMFGVAMRGQRAGQNVRLLRARRHACGGARPLDIEYDGWHFGEIGKADKFLHQRNAGPGSRREGACAVPAV